MFSYHILLQKCKWQKVSMKTIGHILVLWGSILVWNNPKKYGYYIDFHNQVCLWLDHWQQAHKWHSWPSMSLLMNSPKVMWCWLSQTRKWHTNRLYWWLFSISSCRNLFQMVNLWVLGEALLLCTITTCQSAKECYWRNRLLFSMQVMISSILKTIYLISMGIWWMSMFRIMNVVN